jgi:hypothetical protein
VTTWPSARSHSIRKWENSSNATPYAMVGHLSRALDVLEGEGVRFSETGVFLQRPASAPIATVLRSEVVSP